MKLQDLVGDLHIIAAPLRDAKAASESCQIDAARDREWFRQNPDQHRRARPASFRELQAFGYPFGTEVIALRHPDGFQFRMYYPPHSG